MSSLGLGNGFWQAMYDHCCPVLLWKMFGYFPSDFLLLDCFHMSFDLFGAPVWISTMCECRLDVVLFLFSIFLFYYNVPISVRRVLIALSLCCSRWWELKCKYWSVCVVFLYTITWYGHQVFSQWGCQNMNDNWLTGCI